MTGLFIIVGVCQLLVAGAILTSNILLVHYARQRQEPLVWSGVDIIRDESSV